MPKNGTPASTMNAKAPVVDKDAVGDRKFGIKVNRLHVKMNKNSVPMNGRYDIDLTPLVISLICP